MGNKELSYSGLFLKQKVMQEWQNLNLEASIKILKNYNYFQEL